MRRLPLEIIVVLVTLLSFAYIVIAPFVTTTEYKAGTGVAGQGFDTDINKTASENINFTANNVTIGIDSSVAEGANKMVNDDFENNSLSSYSQAETGSSRGCFINSTIPINGSFSLGVSRPDGDFDAMCIRRPSNYSVNSEPTNITFYFNVSATAGGWLRMGLDDDNATDGSFAGEFMVAYRTDTSLCTDGKSTTELCYMKE